MVERLILCGGCGAKNRIGDRSGRPKCGKCGKPLNLPRSGLRFRIPVLPLSIAVVVAVGGGILYLNHNDGQESNLIPLAPRATAPLVEDRAPRFAPPVREFPVPEASALTRSEIQEIQSRLAALNLSPGVADGVIGPNTIAAIRRFQDLDGMPVTGEASRDILRRLRQTSIEPRRVLPPPQPIHHGIVQAPVGHLVAPFSVKTSPGSNYFLKVAEISGRTVMTAYIVGGTHFETLMPLGTFIVKYASGDVWYGEDYKFGPDTQFAKADEVFHFQFDGVQYMGFRIELIRQVGGNLRTSSIRPEDF